MGEGEVTLDGRKISSKNCWLVSATQRSNNAGTKIYAPQIGSFITLLSPDSQTGPTIPDLYQRPNLGYRSQWPGRRQSGMGWK
jgi:hypothetical protein